MTTMRETEARAMLISIEEAEVLHAAESILAEAQMEFGTMNTIQSLETGEIITGEEIARARAILDFIANYRMVRVC